MKTIWIIMLLPFLSIVAYSGFSSALSNAAQVLSETPASRLIQTTPPLLNTPAGAIAFGAFSGKSAPVSTRNDNHLPVNLSTYLFLHKTWNEGIPAPATAAELDVCPE